MSTLALSVKVTRPELALADLELEDAANGYRVVQLGPGALEWRRDEVASPYAHGRYVAQAVRDQKTARLAVRVSGATGAALNTRVDTLLNAFEQFAYELICVIDGVTWRWACSQADYAPADEGAGGTFSKFHLLAKQRVYGFDIPRAPVPVAGSD